ncbi:cadherin-1-like [Arapaima gigas]
MLRILSILLLLAVISDNCCGHQRGLFSTGDVRFKVGTNGTVPPKRPVNLFNRQHSFVAHQNSKGRKGTTRVLEQHEPRSGRHHQDLGSKPSAQPGSTPSTPSVPVLDFPWSSSGAKRRKRNWIIPFISIPENDEGPFPKAVMKIRSSFETAFTVLYAITGPGADQAPEGLFTMDKSTGELFMTQSLDRERQSSYTLLVHALAIKQGVAEEPMEIVINVIDVNDNMPVFTKKIYKGHVPEVAPEGYEIVRVSAPDPDDPNTKNGKVTYTIMDQDPKHPNDNIFAINSSNGQIKLIHTGLDRETCPQYTLTVQAADLTGRNSSGPCKVVIEVADSNDHAPQFVMPTYSVSVLENKKDAEVARMFVYDSDDPLTPAWFTKFHIIQGNDDGLFHVTSGPCHTEGVITTVKVKCPRFSRAH